MKKFPLKGMMPYIIINAITYAVIGAFIGKSVVELLNTKKIIHKDYQLLKNFFRDMGGKATHIKLEDLDELEKTGDGDDHKPIEPVPIYIYD